MLFTLLQHVQLFLASRSERHDETGATAVEYGLLVALIAAFIVSTVVLLGGQINTAFMSVVNAIADNVPAP